MNEVKVFCPATIANLSCGFDVMGLCLEGVGDEMIIRKVDKKGIKITNIIGANLPLDSVKNVAGVAALALIENLKIDYGFEIEIHKNIKSGSGIGSSSASAAGAVFGINALLENPFTTKELICYAMQGEVLASGTAHADNVAPCLLGGFTLVRGYNPLDVVQIPVPTDLFATVIHPQVELKTSEMRAVLPHEISLKNAITQWGNVGGLVSGLFLNDYDLISRSLQDVVVEPFRSKFIPEFDNLKNIAASCNALGCGISGSGPSVFALSKGIEIAKNTANAFKKHFQKTNIPFDIHVSKIATSGCRVI
ncbi:MAG: Homoserine kinase [Bacteroidota bacterium]|jgi:homoserine kinase